MSATVSPYQFVLNAFSTSVTMSTKAIVDDKLSPVIDASAAAVFYISQRDIQEVFQVYTNSDVISDISYDRLHFFVFADKWPSTTHINPVNAMMDQPLSSNPMLSVGIPNEMLVKHDFVRYLSNELFNTPMGTDLFSNQTELLNNLDAIGETVYQQDISAGLWKYAATSSRPVPADVNSGFIIDHTTGLKATTADLATEDNLCFVLTNKLLEVFPERFSNLQLNSQNLFHVPILAGDILTFVITINPAPDQNTLTGVPPFGGRSYQIKIVVDDGSHLNTQPID